MRSLRFSVIVMLASALVQSNSKVMPQNAAADNRELVDTKTQSATQEGAQQDVQSKAVKVKSVEASGTIEKEAGDPPKMRTSGWRHTAVLVKADWRNAATSDKILKDIRSVCSADRFEWLQSLDSDPLRLGPGLALGRPGYVAAFESAEDLAEQVAWLSQHGLIEAWIDAGTIEDSVLARIPTIKALASTTPASRLLWRTELIQEDVSADYVKNPFRRLKIARTLFLEDDSRDETHDRRHYIDIANFEFGSEFAGEQLRAYAINFFPLQRDAGIRSELASMSDVAAFLIVYPMESEFCNAVAQKPSDKPTKPSYHFEPGDFKASVSEQSISTHGWEDAGRTSAVDADAKVELVPEVLDGRLQRLKAEFQQLELAVQAGSGQFSNPNVDQDQQSRELRKLVEQSFDLRQQLQELEAQRLRLKLQQVENNLAVRAKSRDAMVTRRMEELRRPDSGNKVPPQEKDNRSTSRDNSGGAESIAPSVADVRIENANSKTQWPQPGEIARQLRSFRESAISDMEAMRDPTMSVETWSQPLEKLIADGLLNPGTGEDAQRDGLVGAKERAAQLQKHLNDVRRDWNYAWSAYQSQLELFRLDLNDRKKEESLAALEVKQQTDANRESPNAYSPGEIRVSEIKLERSRIAVQRAEQILKLYADIEANEPELNPATLEGLNEVAVSKEPTASVPIEPGQNLPQQVISMAEQLRKLRDVAVKFREERQPHENLITQYSRPLEQLKAEGVVTATATEDFLKTQIARSKPEFDRLTEKLDAATKAWKQAWSAYQSQSRLLELEVTHAQNSLVSAEQTLRETHAKMNQGLVGSQEVRETEARREAAVSRLEKAREVLHLWQELENNEPELRPESSTKNLQVSGSGEAKTQKGIWDTEKGKTLNELLKELRDEALRLRKERQADEALLTQCSRPLEELKAEGIVSAETTVEELERKIKESRARFDSSDLAIAMQRWREAWNAYPRGIQSMENQIKELERRIETEQKVLEQAEARQKAGLGHRDDVLISELRMKHWKEETLPSLKQSVEEMKQQFEQIESELNPDWKPESGSITAEPTQE